MPVEFMETAEERYRQSERERNKPERERDKVE